MYTQWPSVKPCYVVMLYKLTVTMQATIVCLFGSNLEKRSWTQMFIRPQAAPGELTSYYKLYHITLTVGNLMKYA